jgi:hypothetical protein
MFLMMMMMMMMVMVMVMIFLFFFFHELDPLVCFASERVLKIQILEM